MKKNLVRILGGVLFFIIGLLVSNEIVSLAAFLIAYLIVGWSVLREAIENIFHGEIFDENFLMALATVGAFFVGEYPEGVAVMLFYQVGEFFQHYAVDHSRKSIAELMDIRPDSANVKRNGDVLQCHPEDVKIGETIVIKPGERIPLDCRVTEGSSMIDTSMLTGESVPRKAEVGTELISGCINMKGMLYAEVLREFSESTVNKILDLVEHASSNKSNSENFITKFARYYTPIVVLVAVILAVIPPLLSWGTFHEYLYRALVFLVVSCPCALVISVPLTFFGGIGGASKAGILVKGSNYLEALADTEIVVFDKTGTLTQGVFEVQEIDAVKGKKEELLEYAAYAEYISSHPIAESIKKVYRKEIKESEISQSSEMAGHGVDVTVFGKRVLAGNAKLMKKFGISFTPRDVAGSIVYIAIDGEYYGNIVIADRLKADTQTAVKALRDVGVKKLIMMTGDSKAIAEKIGEQLGLDYVYAELLPADKVARMEELLAEKSLNKKLVFVGDGINDAPVLARADLGVAMGGVGSDAAIEAADVVLMTDEPSKLETAIRVAKKTLRIAKQNTIFAIAVKIGILILGALGIAGMWAAVFADVGVSVIAILNALRALRR
ncbi:MAG: cadmium-translocating P-type ATPase [Clostridia bacterium]|nr:cadmium-translocating P-type ATPase [Clostridia bacterium]